MSEDFGHVEHVHIGIKRDRGERVTEAMELLGRPAAATSRGNILEILPGARWSPSSSVKTRSVLE